MLPWFREAECDGRHKNTLLAGAAAPLVSHAHLRRQLTIARSSQRYSAIPHCGHLPGLVCRTPFSGLSRAYLVGAPRLKIINLVLRGRIWCRGAYGTVRAP